MAPTNLSPANPSLPTCLVTGATGNIGQGLIQSLDFFKHRLNVVAGVHQPNDVSDLQRKVTSIIDIDYDDPASMKLALTGVNYLFLVPSHSQHRAAQCMSVVKLAQEARVRYIVCISLLGCESRAGVFCSQFKDIERCIEQSGIPYTFLQCAPLQQNMIPLQANFKQAIGYVPLVERYLF